MRIFLFLWSPCPVINLRRTRTDLYMKARFFLKKLENITRRNSPEVTPKLRHLSIVDRIHANLAFNGKPYFQRLISVCQSFDIYACFRFHVLFEFGVFLFTVHSLILFPHTTKDYLLKSHSFLSTYIIENFRFSTFKL